MKEIYNKSGIKGIFNWLILINLKKTIPSSMNIATWYNLLGKKEKALDWLEKAFEDRSQDIPRINIDPDFASLRNEPRFLSLIRKMNLPYN